MEEKIKITGTSAVCWLQFQGSSRAMFGDSLSKEINCKNRVLQIYDTEFLNTHWFFLKKTQLNYSFLECRFPTDNTEKKVGYGSNYGAFFFHFKELYYIITQLWKSISLRGQGVEDEYCIFIVSHFLIRRFISRWLGIFAVFQHYRISTTTTPEYTNSHVQFCHKS